MLPLDHLLAFVAASVVLILIPGPSVVFVVSRAIAHGRRAALATVAGNSLGVVVLVTAVAFGVGSVVERSAVVFTTIKLVGAAYLVYLGIRTFRARGELAALLGSTPVAPRGRRMVGQGFVVGLTNPKAMVFFAAVLPQFVDRGAGDLSVQMLLLGALFVVMAMVLDGAWGLAAGTVRDWMARSPRRLAMLGGTGGLMMIGLGTGLAVTGRAD
jgi:threonine/homoserine/homoserine lactone efflux protein